MWPLNRTVRGICVAAVVVGFLNFAVFWITAVALGGDAYAGGHQGSHYFLSSHGRLTEVSEAVWQYSRIHSASVWVTHPLALLCGFLLVRELQHGRSPD
jgi:hypothetical protein